MSVMSLDIEIIQDPLMIKHIPKKAPKERTDPWEKLKVDSNFNKTCCWAMFDGNEHISAHLKDCGSENRLLRKFWHDVVEFDVNTFITFNGLTFDIPFLLKRSWINHVLPTRTIDLRRYTTKGNHLDVRAILSNWDNYARGDLALYASMLGLNKLDDIDGSQVQGLWDAGEYDKVKEYCESDAMITWQIYESMKGYYV
jgi:uncharacterized protein YprB with RNaseH-like and TPR domain